ncbi:MAG: translocation/assembly module TamB domain-containing protein [Bradymonadaceae bacterium]|nr:translocation/assembly module TamB domain-containing protein [Lujinxingiaceae bacterium]
MKRILKTGAKVLIALLLLLVVLVLGLLLLLQTSFVKDQVRDRVVAGVNAELLGSVEVGRIEGNLLTSARLIDVTVRDEQGHIVARVPRVEASYSLFGLARGQMTVKSVELDRPVAVVRRREDGHFNYTNIGGPSEDGSPSALQVFVDAIVVHDGLVLYLDQSLRISPARERALAEFVALVEAEESFALAPDEFAALADAIIRRARRDGEQASTDAPVLARASELNAALSVALHGDQRVRFDVDRLDADALTDTLAVELPMRSQNLRGFFDPAFLEIEHERFDLGLETGWQDLSLRIAFVTSTDAFGRRTPETIEQIFARFEQFRASQQFLEQVVPNPRMLIGLSLTGQVAGSLDDLWFDLAIEPIGQPGNISVVGNASLADEALDKPMRYRAIVRAQEIEPGLYAVLDDLIALSVGDATIIVEGSGSDPQTALVSVGVSAETITVDAYQLDTVYLRARYDAGHISVEPVALLTPYLDLVASGIFDPSGVFSAELRTTAEPAQAERAAKIAAIRPSRADLNFEVTGTFDPQIEPISDALKDAQLTGRWDFSDFEAAEIKIGSSSGAIDAGVHRVGSANEQTYEANFRLAAQGTGLQTAQGRITSLSTRASGSGALSLPIDEPLLALRNLATTWQVNASGVRVEGARINDTTLVAQVSQAPGDQGSFTYSLRGNMAGVSAADARLDLLATDLRGQISLNPGKDGLEALRRISTRGSIDVHELRSGEIRAHRLQTSLDFAGPPDGLLGHIEAAATNTTAAGQRFENVDLRLELAAGRAFQISARAVPHEAPVRTLRAELGGAYHADLEGVDLTQLQFATRRLAWSLQQDGRLSLRADRLVFDQFYLQSGAQRIGAHGTFRPSGGAQELDILAENLDLAVLRRGFFLDEMAEVPDVGGQINMDASLRGTFRRPTITARLQARDLRLEENPPVSVDMTAHYANERLELRDLVVQAFEQRLLTGSASLPASVDLTGTSRIYWDRPLSANLNLVDFQLADFHPYIEALAEQNVEGAVAGSIVLAGTIDEPRVDAKLTVDNFTFQGEVDADFLDLREVNLATELSYRPPVGNQGGLVAIAKVDWKGERVVDLDMAAPIPLARWIREPLDGSGPGFVWNNALLATPFRLALKVPRLEVRSIPLQSLREADASGIVSIDIDARGTLGDPRGDVKIALENFGWTHFRDIFINVDASVANQIINIDRLRLEWDADEILVARGTVPLPIASLASGVALQDLPGDFAIELREIPIAKLSAIDYGFARIRGSVAGYVRMTGTLRNPKFDSRVGLFNTELGDGRLGTVSASIVGHDNVVEAHASFCREFETILKADARLPITTDIIELSRGASVFAPGALDIAVTSEQMNLAQMLPNRLIEDYVTDASGQLRIGMQISGTWAQPTAAGELRLTNGAATLPLVARRFESIEANIALDDQRLAIREVSLRDGPSSVRLEGQIAHDALRPGRLDLTATTRDFNLGGLATEFPAYVSSDVTARGDLSASPSEVNVEVSGLNVVLTETQARDTHPVDLHEDIIVLDRNAKRVARDPRDLTELATMRDSNVDLLNMRVNVNVARDAWVRHPTGDVNIQAEIQADMLGTVVAVTGQVEALRGEFEFIGRRFVVQQSTVLFTGSIPPNPRLTIEAIHPLDRAIVAAVGEPTTGEARIIFRITGTAEDPRLELLSDPPMTDSEILFVLVTGRPPDRSDVGQDESVAGRAFDAVSGIFAGVVRDRLAGTIDVDLLRVEAGQEGIGRIEVGKYITPSIFASIRRQFGSEEVDATNIIRIEYHFLPRWMFEVVYSDRAEGELNLYWDVY